MEGAPGVLREVAHDLRAYEQVEQERGVAEGFRGAAGGGRRPGEGGGGLPGQHVDRGPPERDGRAQKRRQSIGRSRGGLTTKTHMAAATGRSALKFSLSGGEAHDAPRGTVPPGGIERYFLRSERFRRVFTRYDKLDVLFCDLIYFVMIVDAIV